MYLHIYVSVFTICIWSIAASAVHTKEVFSNEASAVYSQEALSDEVQAASPVIQQLVERMSVLETRDRDQQRRIDLLEARVDSQDKEIIQLRKHEAEKDLTTSDKKRRTELDSNIYRKRRYDNEVTVAFFVGLSTSIQHAGENQNIVFDHVETNEGNGYNPHHGVFTTPVDGIYVFTTSILTTSGRKICEIVVNGARKAQVYSHGDGHYDHGTQTVIVHLKKGDDVAIQIVEHNNDYTIHGESPPYTTFSGFLLQQDFSDTIVGK